MDVCVLVSHGWRVTSTERRKLLHFYNAQRFRRLRILLAFLPNQYRIKMLSGAGPVAQRLEQRTHNPLVPGSNPGGPTNIPKDLARFSVFVNFSIVGTFVGTVFHVRLEYPTLPSDLSCEFPVQRPIAPV